METNFVEKNQKVDLNGLYSNYIEYPTAKNLENLLIAFQPFITTIANNFKSSLSYCNCDFEDLQQEANLYLVKIIQDGSYKLNSKTSFTSYCYLALSNKIKRLLNRASTPFNIDTYALNKLKAIRNYYKLGDKSNLTDKDIKKYQVFNIISLNTIINSDENDNECELGDLIPIDNDEEKLYNRLDFEYIIDKIKTILSKRDFDILIDKYINELSLTELSIKYNMSKKEIQNNLSQSIKAIQKNI